MTTTEVAPRTDVPLVPHELRGFRQFRLAADGLHPTVKDRGPWVEDMRAACGLRHDAPAAGCACGLYGWYDPADVDPSGLGDTDAVIAASGRVVLGDRGFRAERARVVAVTIPPRIRPRGEADARVRALLAERYPEARVYRSKRQMLRDHPRDDVSAFGVGVGISEARRRRRAVLGLWLVGVLALWSVMALPDGVVSRAPVPVWLAGIVLFLAWQVALFVGVGRMLHGVAER